MPPVRDDFFCHREDYDKKTALLDAALPLIAQQGWTLSALEAGAEQANIAKETVWCLFPDGPIDALRIYHHMLNQRMVEAVNAMPLQTMGVTEKITWCVRVHLSLMELHKAVAAKTAHFLVQPAHLWTGKQLLAEMVHQMWILAGDTSTDYNFYTKRLLLAGVYSSTFLYWLRDTSPSHQKTWDFLNRRIQNILQIHKLKPAFRAPIQALSRGVEAFRGMLRNLF